MGVLTALDVLAPCGHVVDILLPEAKLLLDRLVWLKHPCPQCGLYWGIRVARNTEGEAFESWHLRSHPRSVV